MASSINIPKYSLDFLTSTTICETFERMSVWMTDMLIKIHNIECKVDKIIVDVDRLINKSEQKNNDIIYV